LNEFVYYGLKSYKKPEISTHRYCWKWR